MIVGIIRRKPVLTHASCGMLASVNSANSVKTYTATTAAAAFGKLPGKLPTYLPACNVPKPDVDK